MATLTVGETFETEIKFNPAASVVVWFVGPQKYSIVASKTADKFIVLADTAQWLPGFYAWEAWATIGDTKSLIARNNFTLQPSARDIVAGTDLRSIARKAVGYLLEMLSGGPSIEARKYKINNRELERHSIAELVQLLSIWERKLAVEERRKQGLSTLGPRIKFRI